MDLGLGNQVGRGIRTNLRGIKKVALNTKDKKKWSRN